MTWLRSGRGAGGQGSHRGVSGRKEEAGGSLWKPLDGQPVHSLRPSCSLPDTAGGPRAGHGHRQPWASPKGCHAPTLTLPSCSLASDVPPLNPRGGEGGLITDSPPHTQTHVTYTRPRVRPVQMAHPPPLAGGSSLRKLLSDAAASSLFLPHGPPGWDNPGLSSAPAKCLWDPPSRLLHLPPGANPLFCHPPPHRHLSFGIIRFPGKGASEMYRPL